MPGFTVEGTGDGGRTETPGQVLDGLRREATARLLPLLGQALQDERVRLERDRMALGPDGRGAEVLAEDLAGVSVLSSELIRHEQRWQKALTEVFAAWPDSPVARRVDEFSLLSDDQLQAQLIGQPVAEALERRFESIRDILDRRLHSMAMSMGYRQRPCNPLAARFVVECFLQAFGARDCGRRLRGALLRRYELLLEGALGPLYAWVNTRLAESGQALAGESDHTLLLSSLGVAADGIKRPHRTSWEPASTGPATPAWQSGGPATTTQAARPVDAPRGNLMRRYMRRLRDAQPRAGTATRSFRPEEFQAALSLLQAERALPGRDTPHAQRMQFGLYRSAAGLGIDRREVEFSPEQEDALALVGVLFDRLATRHLLLPEAAERLSLLALPYLHLALDDARLFESSSPPAMQLLSVLVELWDGADGTDDGSRELLTLADRASAAIVDSAHGDGRVFPSQLAQIDAALAPGRRRAEAAERRAWQALRGRERLDAARREASLHIARRMRDRPLLPSVASFLDGEWRQALAQAWLREGPASDRYREMLSLGDALLDVDALAVGHGGSAVADRLLDILPALRECCVQCGVAEAAIDAQLAGLVAEHASPTPRSVHAPTVADDEQSGALESHTAEEGPVAADGFAEGQRFVQPGASGAARVLRLAWRSGLTGACLLVNLAGMKELLLAPATLRARIADGSLQARPLGGAVAVALDEIAERARAA